VNNMTAMPAVTDNAPLVQEIPLDRIVESKSNPRKIFDSRKLQELAAFVPRNKSGLMWPYELCGIGVRRRSSGGPASYRMIHYC